MNKDYQDKIDNFPTDPCKDCSNLTEDRYGMLCDLACGLHTAWLGFMAGVEYSTDNAKKVTVAE